MFSKEERFDAVADCCDDNINAEVSDGFIVSAKGSESADGLEAAESAHGLKAAKSAYGLKAAEFADGLKADESVAADGLNYIRPLDQLCGCVKTIFVDFRSMLMFFLGELRRWSGEHKLNRVFYERS